MDREYRTLILAGLLHDVGKFWKRAGYPGPHHEASASGGSSLATTGCGRG